MLLPKLKVPPRDPSRTTTYLGSAPAPAGFSPRSASSAVAGVGADPPSHAPDAARAPSARTPNSHLTSRLMCPPPGLAALLRGARECRSRGTPRAVSFLNRNCHGIQAAAHSVPDRRNLRSHDHGPPAVRRPRGPAPHATARDGAGPGGGRALQRAGRKRGRRGVLPGGPAGAALPGPLRLGG